MSRVLKVAEEVTMEWREWPEGIMELWFKCEATIMLWAAEA